MNGNTEKKLKEIAEKVAAKHGIDFLLLFGSHADGSARKDSDFDIAYARTEQLSFEEEFHVGEAFSSVFKTDEFDVIHLARKSPVFLYHIMKDAKLLYAREPRLFYNLYTYALKRAQEVLPLYQMKFDRLCAKYAVA